MIIFSDDNNLIAVINRSKQMIAIQSIVYLHQILKVVNNERIYT